MGLWRDSGRLRLSQGASLKPGDMPKCREGRGAQGPGGSCRVETAGSAGM
jgi:hypothetical protein